MYGIINKSIEELVKANFGDEKWDEVLERSGVKTDFFLSHEIYDDEITFKLAIAVSEVTELTLSDVLQAFGEWWILKTGKEKYTGLMEAGGSSLREFMINLPTFHNRIMLIYPKLTPPEFKVSHVTDNSLHVHYFSKREGLQEFVRGLLFGLGKMFDTKVEVELLQTRNKGDSHEVFKLKW
ncbi:heme NO-binding domain-containing protein [Persicitalea jodogahamensis]|uniref:Heme NO-binding domain-containing protein n=1 Tax=Persicitalea jodogahamensis TaxID=402147 RepID=A0A8J3GB55_9BACT|nr:heme NO-binding domain-containing protein [Persicitalea jodogahamensis]GHB79667.1 hypothetical protein GCM10007390_37220 [Persicitalea jodogahamensis]